MAILTGGIETPSSFQPLSSRPLDLRLLVDDVADLVSIVFPYDGMIVRIKSTKEYYTYNSDTLSWEIFSGGASTLLIREETFLNANQIIITHNLNRFVGVLSVLIETAVVGSYQKVIIYDEFQTVNELTIQFNSNQTGIILYI